MRYIIKHDYEASNLAGVKFIELPEEIKITEDEAIDLFNSLSKYAKVYGVATSSMYAEMESSFCEECPINLFINRIDGQLVPDKRLKEMDRELFEKLCAYWADCGRLDQMTLAKEVIQNMDYLYNSIDVEDIIK